MKIITLVCSPRKHGNSNEIADYILSKFKNWAKEKIYFPDYSFKSCTGCMRCQKIWKDADCLINKKDDDQLYKNLNSADVLVFICPTLGYSIPSQVKAWGETTNHNFKNKVIAIVAIGGIGNTNVVDLLSLWFLPNNFYAGWTVISTESTKKKDAYITGGLLEEFNHKQKIGSIVKNIKEISRKI